MQRPLLDCQQCPLVEWADLTGLQAAAEDEGPLTLDTISLDGLAFRSIGPAVTGGRIIDIEVNPEDHAEYYVASGHGSLWKTTNNGVTFSPVFDGQSSFSIGAVALDPSNPNVVWAGTGENNQGCESYFGIGLLRSTDGGDTWQGPIAVTNSPTNQAFLPTIAVADNVGIPGAPRYREYTPSMMQANFQKANAT